MFRSLSLRRIFLNFFLALLVFVLLVSLTFRWLDVYTNHGKDVEVPRLVGIPVQEARKILEGMGLYCEVDSLVYNAKYNPFQVLSIYPPQGSRVKDARAIVLRVNPKTIAKISVPDVLGRYKYVAFKQLELVGLTVGDVLYEPSSLKDVVIRMEHEGTLLQPGDPITGNVAVDLVVGKGPGKNVPVPNLIGHPVAQAKRLIEKNYFEVGLVKHEDGIGDESDVVYYQIPLQNSVLDQGLQIDLWASKRPPMELKEEAERLDSIHLRRPNLRSFRTEKTPSKENSHFQDTQNDDVDLGYGGRQR